MSANQNSPYQWADIIKAIRDGNDDEAVQMLVARDRKADSYFSTFSHEQFLPVLYQNGAVVASTGHYVEGFRVGPYVWYKGSMRANAAGTANGYLSIGLPPFLPQVSPPAGVSHACGVFHVADVSANIHQTGVCFQTVAIAANQVACIDDNTAAFLGQAGTSFTAALAADDRITWAVMYQTSVAQ